MTDTDVWHGIESAKRKFKAAETRAEKKFSLAAQRAFKFYGFTDIEQASRQNALQRARAVSDAEISKARISLIDALENLRARAGEWADLVPIVRL